ncbi:MAG: hypothetical protein LBF16_07565 [Pseudomonadales bacterium]|jgi:hypothetical protein|nr:hypothetical protein [Pseudomonadales bacterium]
MKRRFIMASLLVCATPVFAAPAASVDNIRLVNADASPLSEICIAAVESRRAALDVAAEYGMSSQDLAEVHCNGMPLVQFAHTYRAPEKKMAPIYRFKSTDASPLTDVCMASVKSAEEFAAAKARLGADITLEEIRCNKLPLAEFARRYGKTAWVASIQ